MNQTARQENEVVKYAGHADTSNVCIVGINRMGFYVFNNSANYLKRHEKIIGFISESSSDETNYGLGLTNILGNVKDIKALAQQYNFKKVVLALDPGEASKIHEIIRACNRNNIDYELVSDFYDVVYGQAFQSIFKDIFHPTKITIRRIIDLLVSVTLFVFLLPSWILIALGIKLDSPGAVLYSQERVGIEGRYFRIFKFRSMRIDAEKYSGPQLATQNDPRITRLGAFLRKTRLDELPQLINVINGDMSLIGPRPERPYFVEKYRREIPFYMNRVKTKPGLTGLAQVEGGYDLTAEDVKNKIKHDLYYIDHANSLLLNLKILFKTVWVVVTAKGV
jgi:exopolysaccharide biosynthesis polyprenyl glycosylphosphotransferase